MTTVASGDLLGRAVHQEYKKLCLNAEMRAAGMQIASDKLVDKLRTHTSWLNKRIRTTTRRFLTPKGSYSDAASRWETYRSLLNILGRYLLGNHMAMAHMSTHRMANSSNIWPRKLRVAWKYVEPIPEIHGVRKKREEKIKDVQKVKTSV